MGAKLPHVGSLPPLGYGWARLDGRFVRPTRSGLSLSKSRPPTLWFPMARPLTSSSAVMACFHRHGRAVPPRQAASRKCRVGPTPADLMPGKGIELRVMRDEEVVSAIPVLDLAPVGQPLTAQDAESEQTATGFLDSALAGETPSGATAPDIDAQTFTSLLQGLTGGMNRGSSVAFEPGYGYRFDPEIDGALSRTAPRSLSCSLGAGGTVSSPAMPTREPSASAGGRGRVGIAELNRSGFTVCESP